MKIIVTKGEVIIHYEEPQKDAEYPKIVSDEHYHKRALAAIELICQQVKELSK